jgi:methionine biosynthesis protein MetW
MSNYSSFKFEKDPNTSWYKIFNLIRPNSKVLDVGCSSGNFGEVLIKSKNCVVDGVELDQKDALEAQRKLRKVYNANIETDPLNDLKDKYDYIYFGDVIEHLVNPSQALIKIKKLLKKDGKILFSIPNMAHASVRLMLLKGDFEYSETGLLDNTHLHFYTLNEIKRVFQAAGCSISLLDNTEATYPPGLIIDQLRELGINETPKLEKLLNNDESRVFQYVGAAEIAKTRKIPLKQYSPDPQGTISLWYQGHLQARDRDLQMMKNQLDVQAKIMNNQAKVLNNPSELVRRIRISRYLKYYIVNKTRALKRRWRHIV